MSRSRRVERVASRIRFLVASCIQRELHDPRIGMVTILGVDLSPDCREAKVYYSVYGDAGVVSRTVHAIEDARGFIQREVGRNLDTRFTPHLSFILDETQERASRIEALIEKVAQNHHGKEEEHDGQGGRDAEKDEGCAAEGEEEAGHSSRGQEVESEQGREP